ncbi:MAG: hypothetical protein ACR2H0_05360 [Candidatus Limnocylindrales bacterium]
MDDDRLARLEQRFEELDRRSNAMERAMDKSRAAMDTMIPSETRKHLKAAGREQLLAVRSLLDYWVNRLADEPEKSNGGRENIRID